MRALVATLCAAACVVVAAGPAWAGPQQVASSVASRVMSPFCPGVTLENCPSEEAVHLRARIERKARAGWSEARIMAWLRNEYGPRIDAEPPAGGIGLLAWLLPAAAVAGGLAVAGLLLSRWVRRPGPPPEPPAAPGDRARLERELAEARRRS